MTTPPWEDPRWLAQAQAWIVDAAERAGARLTGPITQPHVRPWSTVLCAPTQSGNLFFKAVAPHQLHEVRVATLLTRLTPWQATPVLAADTTHGWLLMPDGGLRLRDVIRADRNLDHWRDALIRYARLQQSLSAHVPALLASGVPDRRLSQLPASFAQLLNEAADLTPDERSRLQALAPAIDRRCATLTALGVPETLHHGDLHDGNVFGLGDDTRFFDWGDCSISHPFLSLRTALVSVEILLDWPDDAPTDTAEFDALRNAYLACWTHIAPLEVLRAALRASRELAALCSALSWQHVIRHMSPADANGYRAPVPNLLRELAHLAAQE